MINKRKDSLFSLRTFATNSKYRKIVSKIDVEADDTYPSCGDQVRFTAELNGQHIVDLGFIGTGCILSQAAAAFIVKLAVEKDIDKIFYVSEELIVNEFKLKIGPTRMRCISVSVTAFKKLQNKLLQI